MGNLPRCGSDQCSLSRIWGGIHPPADDIPGRLMGAVIGPDAYDLALTYFEGSGYVPCDGDLVGNDGLVDVMDLLAVLAAWGTNDPQADLDGSGTVGISDLLMMFESWGMCPA